MEGNNRRGIYKREIGKTKRNHRKGISKETGENQKERIRTQELVG